uniref:Hand n=1 Tax=Limnogonus franciscanus TaxID=913166 RepID=A0A4V2HA20_9HEMI|nr:Hand [Limnogonus franciscanus]
MTDQLSPHYPDENPRFVDMNHYYPSQLQYHCIPQNQEIEESCDTSYYWTDDLGSWSGTPEGNQESLPIIKVVKRRNTANNKKERRRTRSINNAFADLRDCIPNVPADTKLSKIKTLRLATSYICYLMGVLETEDPGQGFNADLSHTPRVRHSPYSSQVEERDARKVKGRTGWPQHVWALELQHEPSAHPA